jgi:hypothetical protein
MGPVSSQTTRQVREINQFANEGVPQGLVLGGNIAAGSNIHKSRKIVNRCICIVLYIIGSYYGAQFNVTAVKTD